MLDSGSRPAAVALWILLAAVVVTALATVVGHLAPALLPAGPRDALGLAALGLVFVAHALPLAAGLVRVAPVPVALSLLGGEA